MSSRFYYLDSLRGVAAMVVVFVHFMASFLPHAVYGNQPQSQSHIPWLEQLFLLPPVGILIAGQLAVSLFFILSGFVLSYRFLGSPVSISESLGLCGKRPFRLGGLVWFSMALYALFWYFGWFHNSAAAAISGSELWLNLWWQGDLNVAALVKDFFTSPFTNGTLYNNPLWTIGYELYGSFLVFAFLLLFSHVRYRWFILLILILLFYKSMLVGFWVGVLLADLKKFPIINADLLTKVSKLVYTGKFIIGFLFLYLAAYPFYLPENLREQTFFSQLPSDFSFGLGYPMLAALFGFVLVLTSPKLQNFFNNRLFSYLGQISYSVYVMHVFVIGTFSSWLFVKANTFLSYGLTFSLVFVTGITLSIFLSHWVVKWVDTPFINFSYWLGNIIKKTLHKKPFSYIFHSIETFLLRHPPTRNF